jgi:hypothetical protein
MDLDQKLSMDFQSPPQPRATGPPGVIPQGGCLPHSLGHHLQQRVLASELRFEPGHFSGQGRARASLRDRGPTRRSPGTGTLAAPGTGRATLGRTGRHRRTGRPDTDGSIQGGTPAGGKSAFVGRMLPRVAPALGRWGGWEHRDLNPDMRVSPPLQSLVIGSLAGPSADPSFQSGKRHPDWSPLVCQVSLCSLRGRITRPAR